MLHAEEAFKAEMVRERWLPISLGQAGILCSFYEIEMIRLLGFEGDVLLFYSSSLFCVIFQLEKFSAAILQESCVLKHGFQSTGPCTKFLVFEDR